MKFYMLNIVILVLFTYIYNCIYEKNLKVVSIFALKIYGFDLTCVMIVEITYSIHI